MKKWEEVSEERKGKERTSVLCVSALLLFTVIFSKPTWGNLEGFEVGSM